MKIGILARMKSKRLPKKHLMDVHGKTLLQRQVDQLKLISSDIYLLVPVSEFSEWADESVDLGCKVFYTNADDDDIVGRVRDWFSTCVGEDEAMIWSGDCGKVPPKALMKEWICISKHFITRNLWPHYEGPLFLKKDLVLADQSKEIRNHQFPLMLHDLDKTVRPMGKPPDDWPKSIDTLEDLEEFKRVWG